VGDGGRAALIEPLLAATRQGRVEPLYLIHGDRVVAEPMAVRLAKAIAERGGHEVEVVKRPPDLSRLLGSLRTLSLFGTGRTLVVVPRWPTARARRS
jgi:DNA polymerase III delta subunit